MTLNINKSESLYLSQFVRYEIEEIEQIESKTEYDLEKYEDLKNLFVKLIKYAKGID